MIEALILLVLILIAYRLWQLPTRSDLEALATLLLTIESASAKSYGKLESIEAITDEIAKRPL
ncbi:TPA: hypothetical protein UL921_002381 [Stenotrophomonas maltophilia]|nr:hypothetical protein [Stenotrophomonas maltophilia]